MKEKDASSDLLMRERERLKKRQRQRVSTNIALLMENQRKSQTAWLSLQESSVVVVNILMQVALSRESFPNRLVSILELTIPSLSVPFQGIPGKE